MGDIVQGPWGGASGVPTEVWDGKVCRCGSAWWTLWLHPDDPYGPAVCVDSTGRIVGYRGFFRCMDCGADGE